MEYNQRAAQAILPQHKVGRVARLYGKRGEVVVQRGEGFPSDPKLLWIEVDGLGVPLWVRSCVAQGANKVVVVFEDFESEELVGQLLGQTLYAEGVEGRQEDQEELALLVGFSFLDETSGRSGRVTEVYASEMNPLLGVVLEGEEEECLVPWAEELLVSFEAKKRRVVLALVEGFFEELCLPAHGDALLK